MVEQFLQREREGEKERNINDKQNRFELHISTLRVKAEFVLQRFSDHVCCVRCAVSSDHRMHILKLLDQKTGEKIPQMHTEGFKPYLQI